MTVEIKQNDNVITSILCVHQGYELYGSDRSFALSVATLQELYPEAEIDVIIPKDGSIRQLLVPVCSNLIVNDDLAVLRKKELANHPIRFIYKVIRGVAKALSTSKKYDFVYINTIVVLDYLVAARFMKGLVALHVREIPTGIQRVIFSKLLSFSRMNLVFNSMSTLHSFDLPDGQNKAVVLNGLKGFSHTPLREGVGQSLRILLIGRLTPWKGQMFFLNALNKLLKLKKFNIDVRIVGDVFDKQVNYKNDLQKYVGDHALGDVVTFKEFTESPENEYQWSDVVVIPSVKPEPFGRVAIEAMSVGRCVVAANHGGLTEIIEDKVNGVFFEKNNLDSLVGELQILLSSSGLISQYAEQGHQTFHNKFSDAAYRNRFKAAITGLV